MMRMVPYPDTSAFWQRVSSDSSACSSSPAYQLPHLLCPTAPQHVYKNNNQSPQAEMKRSQAGKLGTSLRGWMLAETTYCRFHAFQRPKSQS